MSRAAAFRVMLVVALGAAALACAACGDPVGQANQAAGSAESYRNAAQLYRAVRALQLPDPVDYQRGDKFSDYSGMSSGTIYYYARPTLEAKVASSRYLEVYLQSYRKVLRESWAQGMGCVMDRYWVVRGPNWILMSDDFERLTQVQAGLGGRISEVSAY